MSSLDTAGILLLSCRKEMIISLLIVVIHIVVIINLIIVDNIGRTVGIVVIIITLSLSVFKLNIYVNIFVSRITFTRFYVFLFVLSQYTSNKISFSTDTKEKTLVNLILINK